VQLTKLQASPPVLKKQKHLVHLEQKAARPNFREATHCSNQQSAINRAGCLTDPMHSAGFSP